MDTPPWGGGVPSGISGIKRIYTKFSGIKPYGGRKLMGGSVL